MAPATFKELKLRTSRGQTMTNSGNQKLLRFVLVFAFLAVLLAWFAMRVFGSVTSIIPKAGKATVVIETGPTRCWSGAVGSASRDGCGPARLELFEQSGIFTAVIQKQGMDHSQLKVSIYIDGDLRDQQLTTSPVGLVTVSASNAGQ